MIPRPPSIHSARPAPFATKALGRILPLLLAALCLVPFALLSEQRFPPPDFESGYKIPTTATPAARGLPWQYIDVAVLAACLGLAVWLIYKKRARKPIIWLSLFSLAYFGFFRKGCICAIGSFQNVSFALADNSYAVPLTAAAFFVLPILVALIAGRAFCAAVCPHGALQDLVLLKPIKVPAWLEEGLSVLPFIYLGAGVLFAATGTMFLACQYDPFVPLFRTNGRILMVLIGVALLLLGIFVGRPFCRFICPYGALLKIGATVAKLRVRVTPDYCTQCRLCEASCPFGAMRQPHVATTEPATLSQDRRRLLLTILLLPILVAAGAFVGSRFSGPASRLHPDVSLAEIFLRERGKPSPTGTLTPDQQAVERARLAPEPVLQHAIKIREQFRIGSPIFGGWIGLVIGAKLLSLALRRKRTDYEPDRGACFACARCFEYCPNEMVRRGIACAIPAPLPVPARSEPIVPAATPRHGVGPATRPKEDK